ncbi:hypothetical protein D3C80_1259990 [compost metagenome]
MIVTSANGCTDTSDCVSVTDVGVKSHSFGAELKAYPNPTLGLVKIDLGKTHHAITLTLQDALGRMVESQRYEETQLIDLDITHARGVYLLTISDNEGRSATIQIVKN